MSTSAGKDERAPACLRPERSARRAQLVGASGATADGYRAAFLAGIAASERVAATSQPTPMSPHRKPPMISQLRRTRLAGLTFHVSRFSRRRVRARCLSPGEAAECPPPSREAQDGLAHYYLKGTGHQVQKVENTEKTRTRLAHYYVLQVMLLATFMFRALGLCDSAWPYTTTTLASTRAAPFACSYQ